MATRATVFLFDIDMTLVDSGGTGRLAFDRAFSDVLGVEGAFDGFHFYGGVDLAIVGEIHARLTGSPVSASMLERLRARYLECLDEELAINTRFRVLPGARELLERLTDRPDCHLGLATGNFAEGAWSKLRAGGLEGFFRTGGFGSDAADRAEMTRVAIRRVCAGLPPGDASPPVYVVGDSPRDVEAAHANGARAIAVATGHASRDALAQLDPYLALDDLRDFDEWLTPLLGAS